MIELKNNVLLFSFPEVHAEARLGLTFQRTLRLPDDGQTYPLPPGLGEFPLRHVDDYASRLPEAWLRRGGVMLPMYQSEAMWLSFEDFHLFERDTGYPFAIKIAAGKINAVSGEGWSEGLRRRPQDYLVSPEQPWLDGFCVAKGVIRQFVAMPLGAGYSAEEQLTGEAEYGGLQVLVYPMKAEVFERRFPKRKKKFIGTFYDRIEQPYAPDMGLTPGGRMRQEIYRDPFLLSDWDLEHGSRCFVHLANSLVWREITGEAPPTVPPTAREYNDAGLPWFDYYHDTGAPLNGAEKLAGLQSVAQMGQAKGEAPVPQNESVQPQHIIQLRSGLTRNQVREGTF